MVAQSPASVNGGLSSPRSKEGDDRFDQGQTFQRAPHISDRVEPGPP
uniref:Predicted protein n=1 Tax=Hordeum vulgare subsp. vulgare TaxID=112509 RepID=F2D3W0_HORVV|nr:predicted protein [Hordeum vulgare subsp. vulgare]